jgi:hypothetical protein
MPKKGEIKWMICGSSKCGNKKTSWVWVTPHFSKDHWKCTGCGREMT